MVLLVCNVLFSCLVCVGLSSALILIKSDIKNIEKKIDELSDRNK